MAKPVGLTAPEKLDFAKLRTEKDIRADLTQQLQAIHLNYLKKWVWPCQ